MSRGIWIIAALLCLSAVTASAHSLNLFVHDEGAAVKGNAYFTGGTPAQNVTVRALDAANNTVGETKTDEKGNFIYVGPRPTGPLKFVVETIDGHRAESTIAANGENGTPSVSLSDPNAPAGGASSSYDDQLMTIHEAIDRLEKHLWLRDVLGGLGYIFGLAGLWALWKSRSGRQSH